MSTVNQVLKLAEDLRELAERERSIQGTISAGTAKADRLNAELTQVQSRIATKKAAFKTAVAELE